ncbi:(E2-independent) E3 ubiquitin-conjugating enzyme FATS isoform X2 [Podarcis raffonei]|uniref:(E2-independent) E3 ubiquitin-conjugating enzyme FATS isoform X2 n=1 Tax=Podarcis raffonei TaxID=65483 RepID=UPI0023295671|nr:(E2-independent) E3 ubiquitin-conjugating enzyme FATS isoform X2 [Podarcis raffonei]
MPSQKRKPLVLSCAGHNQMDLRTKLRVARNQERKPFISQICFMINHASWGKPCCLGIRENQYGINAWEACKTVQYNTAAKNESSFTKESLPSQNTKMISSILISQMIDENKSKENKAPFPMKSVITQSDAYRMSQSLANHSSVNINRAFILLPRRLGIQISSDDNVFGTDSHTKEETQCQSQRKGFASITITARRVVPPSHSMMQVDASDPPCLKCRGRSKLLMNTAPASNVTGLDHLCRPFHAQRCCQNGNATEIKVSEPCPQPCTEQSGCTSSTENKENRRTPPRNSHKKQAPISFTSSIHFSISQRCPNTIYYIDKSLSVPVDQPRTKNQKMHRSVMSFNINCSSPTLTPDGVDGLANGELITEVLKTKLPEESKAPHRTIWNADLKENYLDEKQTSEKEPLGTEYLQNGTFPSETLPVVDSLQGHDNLKLTQSNDGNSNDNHSTLSPHIPHWTYDEGTQASSGSNRKQCIRDRHYETALASFLEQSSKKELMVEGGISLTDKHQPKGTSESKESQTQSFLKPKTSFSDHGYHIKALSKRALGENAIYRKDPFPKGDYKFCGLAIKLKEHQKSEMNKTIDRVTTSTAHEPDVTHEKHEAFQQPEVCSEPENIPENPLTLREALEVHKPHFISRSQERLKKLKHMVQLRKTQQGDASRKKQGAALSRKLSTSSITSKKKQYTIPHPLSDNLFKPKERFISEKEMHMRSKRIYNNLPEVKKKQEEKQKRVIIQSNRLRVEVFKKQLLDQLLQRNTE